MKPKTKLTLLPLVLVPVIVGLDQWTKTLVRKALPVGESIAPINFLGDFFRILHWKNTGAAFGIFQNANLILMILSSLIVVVLAVYYISMKENNTLIRIGLAMAMGGALGNLIDRVTQGYVTDFMSFGRFPIFNLGDSAVTVGVGLMVLALLLESRQKNPSDQTETAIKDENV